MLGDRLLVQFFRQLDALWPRDSRQLLCWGSLRRGAEVAAVPSPLPAPLSPQAAPWGMGKAAILGTTPRPVPARGRSRDVGIPPRGVVEDAAFPEAFDPVAAAPLRPGVRLGDESPLRVREDAVPPGARCPVAAGAPHRGLGLGVVPRLRVREDAVGPGACAPIAAGTLPPLRVREAAVRPGTPLPVAAGALPPFWVREDTVLPGALLPIATIHPGADFHRVCGVACWARRQGLDASSQKSGSGPDCANLLEPKWLRCLGPRRLIFLTRGRRRIAPFLFSI